MQDLREIPAIVNEKIVIKVLKFSDFEWGASFLMPLGNKRTDRSAWILRFITLDR